MSAKRHDAGSLHHECDRVSIHEQGAADDNLEWERDHAVPGRGNGWTTAPGQRWKCGWWREQWRCEHGCNRVDEQREYTDELNGHNDEHCDELWESEFEDWWIGDKCIGVSDRKWDKWCSAECSGAFVVCCWCSIKCCGGSCCCSVDYSTELGCHIPFMLVLVKCAQSVSDRSFDQSRYGGRLKCLTPKRFGCAVEMSSFFPEK